MAKIYVRGFQLLGTPEKGTEKGKEKGTLRSCSARDLRVFMSRLISMSGDLDGTDGKASGETAETP
jgi:hypothetical protein